MTALSIVALAIFIFGAYAYGSVVVLSLRHRSPVWVPRQAPDPSKVKGNVHGMAMFVLCTLWFVLHSINEFRGLLGQPRTTDLIDVAALELVFGFPGLIFHTVLIEAAAGKQGPPPRGRLWSFVLFALYASGAALAIYAPVAIAGLIPAPVPLGAILGFSVGLLFTVSSICSMAVMATRHRPSPTTDQRRLR